MLAQQWQIEVAQYLWEAYKEYCIEENEQCSSWNIETGRVFKRVLLKNMGMILYIASG